jgi:hypothetical protein
MKEFGDWVKDMAGSIPDNSWTGKCVDKRGDKPLTEWQLRKAWTDMFVDWEKDPTLWLNIFCTDAIRNATSFRPDHDEVIGKKRTSDWYATKRTNEVFYLKKFRKEIDDGATE